MKDCLHLTAPNDEEMLKYVLDDVPLPPGEKEHLKQCTVCQQRLVRYQRINRMLLAQLYRSQCPSATVLSHYCAGMLPADEVMSIVSHLEDCPLCASEVADTRRILNHFDPFAEAEAFQTPRAVIRRIITSLVPPQPLLVTRGDNIQQPWPRQYRAEGINLSLHLSRASNGDTMLLGLLTSNDPEESVENFEGLNVELYNAPLSNQGMVVQDQAGPLCCTQVDDLGNIVFKAISAGEYAMIVHLPEAELVIEGLDIEHT